MEADVDDDAEDEGLADRGEGVGGEGAGDLAPDGEDENVPEDGMNVEEDIVDHDVDLGAALLDQELIVDAGKDTGGGLTENEGDSKAEGGERGEAVGGEGAGGEGS